MTTLQEAVRLWVGRDFSAIPSALLERAYKAERATFVGVSP